MLNRAGASIAAISSLSYETPCRLAFTRRATSAPSTDRHVSTSTWSRALSEEASRGACASVAESAKACIGTKDVPSAATRQTDVKAEKCVAVDFVRICFFISSPSSVSVATG